MNKTSNKNAKNTVASPESRERATPFDPVSVPVKGYKLEPMKIGRRTRYRTITELDGVGAAAVSISEKDVASWRKKGHQIAYVCFDLCIVTTDLAFVKKLASDRFDADELPKVMAFYAEYVGKPIEVDPVKFENQGGAPYGVYDACYDDGDFSRVDAAMVKEYGKILKRNAVAAKSKIESNPLYVTITPRRTVEASVLHYAWAEHEHEKAMKEAHATAIYYSTVFKARHGLARIDHAHPAYRAFTSVPWNEYLAQRDHMKEARRLLREAAEVYSLMKAESRL